MSHRTDDLWSLLDTALFLVLMYSVSFCRDWWLRIACYADALCSLHCLSLRTDSEILAALCVLSRLKIGHISSMGLRKDTTRHETRVMRLPGISTQNLRLLWFLLFRLRRSCQFGMNFRPRCASERRRSSYPRYVAVFPRT